MDAEEYDDTNRAFLQAFMVRGTMSMKEGKLVLAAIFTAAQGRGDAPLNAITFLQIKQVESKNEQVQRSAPKTCPTPNSRPTSMLQKRLSLLLTMKFGV